MSGMPSSAQILPFPAERRAEDRLQAALRSLENALDEQRDAMTEFRAHLGALGGAVAELEDSLHRYRGRLAATHADVLATRQQALRLEAIAEGWLSRTRVGAR